MAKIVNEMPDGHFAQRLLELMEKKEMSIRDLAVQTESTYEHIRKLVRGIAYPSKYLLMQFSQIFGVKQEELEKLAVADKIGHKYGKMPALISGKNPEMLALEKFWEKLTDDQKTGIVAQIKALAAQNQGKR